MIYARRVLGVLIPFVLAAPAIAQQASNSCQSAPVLAVNTTVASTSLGATSEVAQTCGIEDSQDVWYRFTANAAGDHVFTVIGIDIDPTVALYAGCSGFPIICNDDISFPDNLDAQVALTLAANQTVRVRIAGNFGGDGDFDIRVDGPAGATLPNDACNAPGVTDLTIGVSAMGSNIGANNSVTLSAASCGGFGGSDGSADVYYRFTPAASNDYTIDTCGSGFDTVLAVFSGCPVEQTNLLACNDDASPVCEGSHTSRIDRVTLNAAQPYFIRVAGYRGSSTATGTFTLRVAIAPPPPGACCRGSTCVVTSDTSCTGFANRFIGSNTTCNVQGNLVTPCCFADFNQTGGRTVQDVFEFLFAYFNNDLAADANGDQTIGVGDIFAYLVAYFGPTC